MRKPRDKRILTVAAAAQELGVTPQTVYRWLREGRLQEVKAEGQIMLITGASVEAAAQAQEAFR